MKEIEKAREALEPCPFCGGKAKEEDIEFCTRIVCQSCYAEARTIEQWNKRIALETEKPTDFIGTAFLQMACQLVNLFNFVVLKDGYTGKEAAKLIQTFFETYHDQKCAECRTRSIKSPCQWCLNSSYFTKGKTIMDAPCSFCVGTETWTSFKFSGIDGHLSLSDITTDVDKKDGE